MAVLSDDDKIFTCSTDFGCPGKTAILNAYHQGKKIVAIAVVGLDKPCPPCQVLLKLSAEWQNIQVLTLDSDGTTRARATLQELYSQLLFAS